jgi:predicted kinase
VSDKVLYLMQGVPGSGKSVIARMIEHWCEDLGVAAAVVSTDNYRLAEDGSYVFREEDNARFHRMAQQDAARLMADAAPAVIVDNTNIEHWQAAPYLALAEIWGYEVQVVSVDCGLQRAIDRQSERAGLGDRAVPAEVITDMYRRMERLLT